MAKQLRKSSKIGEGESEYDVFQIRWKKPVRDALIRLKDHYDSGMSLNSMLNKYVIYGIENHWIPGYVQKDPPTSKDVIMGNVVDLDKLAHKSQSEKKY